MGNLISIGFWFNMNPGSLAPVFLKLLYAAAALFFAGAAAAKIFSKIDGNRLHKPLWKKCYYFFLTNFIIGLFIIFFNAQSIMFFSARFWFLAWLAGDAVWLYFIVKALSDMPAKRKMLEKEMEYKKYLPR